jgi:hypothetical protein
MPSLFKNRKKQKASEQHEVQDLFLKTIVNNCIRCQSRWAVWMQRKTEKLSERGKVMMLLIFVLLTGSYSIYLIGKSFENQTTLLSITPIKSPKHFSQSGDEALRTNSIISKMEYEKINQFKQYMDSLSHSSTGKVLYDSIVAYRPGLMDSIQIIENMYQSQIKK